MSEGIDGYLGPLEGLVCAARSLVAAVMEPDGREEQAGGPPGEGHDTEGDLPGEVHSSKICPQTVDDAADQASNDAEPPQRICPERTIEERSRDHAHMITRPLARGAEHA